MRNSTIIISLLFILIACNSGIKKEMEYYENGNLKFEVSLKNEKRDGIAYGYHPNGKLKSKVEWKNGKKNGEALYYYENGELQSKGFYKDDTIRVGEVVLFLKNGLPLEKQVYNQEGDLIYYAGYDDAGKKAYGSIIPVITPEKDTIGIDETYMAKIRFGYPLKGDATLALGKIEGNSFIPDHKILPDQLNQFEITHKPTKEGVNTIALRFYYETVPEDTLSSLDQTTTQHSYYVR